MTKMTISCRAEYNCGHPPREICSSECTIENLSEQVKAMVHKCVAPDGLVHVNCGICNRGAVFLESMVNGRTIARSPVSIFRDDPRSIFSKAPPESS
jgi:hypothetical protein